MRQKWQYANNMFAPCFAYSENFKITIVSIKRDTYSIMLRVSFLFFENRNVEWLKAKSMMRNI